MQLLVLVLVAGVVVLGLGLIARLEAQVNVDTLGAMDEKWLKAYRASQHR